MSPQPSLLLYDHPVSSYAQKVRVALREKGLHFEAVPPFRFGSSSSPDPEFVKANPRGEVPVLVVANDAQSSGKLSIVDSRIICEYLDERFPEKPLLPKNCEGRAKTRMIEQFLDAQYEAINWAWGEVYWMKRAEGPLREHIRSEVQRQTNAAQAWLEAQIEPSGWLTGPDFGLADAAAGPIVHRSAYFGFPPVAGSKLDAWLEKVRGWPSMKQTLKEFDENEHQMSKMSEIFLSGERKREYRDYRLEQLVKTGGISIVLDGIKNNNIRFPWPEGNQLV